MELDTYLKTLEAKTPGASAERELSMAAGLSWPTVNRIRRGVQRASLETAEKLEKATGGTVTVSELLIPVSHRPVTKKATASRAR